MKVWLLIPKYKGADPLGVYSDKATAIALRDKLDIRYIGTDDGHSLYDILERDLDAPPLLEMFRSEEGCTDPRSWQTTYWVEPD